MAACGTEGRNIQNTHRDKFTYLIPKMKVPQPDVIQIPLLVEASVDEYPYTMLSPNRMIAAIRREWPELWSDMSGAFCVPSW